MGSIIEHGHRVVHSNTIRLFPLASASEAQEYALINGATVEDYTTEYTDPAEDYEFNYRSDLDFGRGIISEAEIFIGARNRELRDSNSSVDGITLWGMVAPLRTALLIGDLTQARIFAQEVISGNSLDGFSAEFGQILVKLNDRLGV